MAGSPRRARQGNEVAVMRALHRLGRLSRADLARELRLNRSSSGHIISDLLADGLVREVEAPAPGERHGRHTGRPGRPGILLELVPEAAAFVGVEVGVEHISVVELDLGAGVVRSAQEGFDGRAAPAEAAVRRALALALGPMPPERLRVCEGLGLASPSQMGLDGVVRVAPLLGWAELDLAELVRAEVARAQPTLRAPVMVENDANALAIGATYGRQAARSGVTLVINMETGVGGGLLIDGHLFRGAHGLAGEIGHLRMGPGGPGGPGGLGGSGGPEAPVTLEERLGLGRTLAEYQARSALPGPRLADFLRNVRDREPVAVSIAEEWARSLAFALAQACRVIDAGSVVLGGSMAALYPLVAARVLSHLRGQQEASFPVPTILVHEDADFGAAFGAACMLHQRFLSREGKGPADAARGGQA